MLIVLHSDGRVQCFADRNVDVHIAHRLNSVIDETPDGANRLDEYLESTLPRSFRNLYWPVKLRAFDQCRKITAGQTLNTRLELELLKEIRTLPEVFAHV